jgi:PilZ domain
MDNERRHSPRKMLLIEVRYEGAGVRAETRICDISDSGVFIEVLSPLSVGEKINLWFTLPDGYPIEAEGVVTQSQPTIGMGVAFTNLNQGDADRIRKFISEA